MTTDGNLKPHSNSVRCDSCDAETSNYNTFITPDNQERNICWECLMREEKSFNAKPGFRRMSRRGIIPR